MFEDFELISSYTRKQGIEDGVLIDLTSRYPEDTRMFKYPVACTASIWASIRKEHLKNNGDLGAMVFDLCYMAARGGIYRRPDPTTALFRVIIGRKTYSFKAICGPNDDASPCITFMELHED